MKLIRTLGISMCTLALVAGCESTDDAPPAPQNNDELAVQVSDNSEVGEILADADGNSLYIFSKDTPGATPLSACQGGCLDAWPVFDAGENPSVAGLDAADLDRFQRADGTMQTTYRGWPLYYFGNDAAPGDLNGEGVGGTWYAAISDSYGAFLRNHADLGSFLTSAEGMTLYVFLNDTPGDAANDPISACEGGCLDAWPILDGLDGDRIPSTLDAADFTIFTRGDGTEQVAYQGRPLYFFGNDAAPGDTNGQGVGGTWEVIDPLAE